MFDFLPNVMQIVFESRNAGVSGRSLCLLKLLLDPLARFRVGDRFDHSSDILNFSWQWRPKAGLALIVGMDGAVVECDAEHDCRRRRPAKPAFPGPRFWLHQRVLYRRLNSLPNDHVRAARLKALQQFFRFVVHDICLANHSFSRARAVR
jgi:hypothetical protein